MAPLALLERVTAGPNEVGMKIFITGATGYIGGSLATKLIRTGAQVIGLARSEQAATALAARGIEPWRGTLSDYAALTDVADKADAFINAANADNPHVVHALLSALAGSGKVFIQTSGSSVVSTPDAGEPSDHVFHEDTPFTPMPEKATRAAIDRCVLNASLLGVHTIVIRPALVYGRGVGVDALSIQIPMLIKQARDCGIARHIGRGLNIWSHLHIDDLTDLYVRALTRAPAGSLFFAENGEASMKSTVQAISRMLGLGGDTEDWPIAAAVQVLGPSAHLSFGSNSRVRADKARAMLDWHPNGPTLLEEIEHGVYRQALK
jgi:nucleoside-diphosphate-sugar epimerase